MRNEDTVNLLRECNAGVKMGVATIDEVLPHVKSKKMETVLNECKQRHERIGNQTHELLAEHGVDGKEPNPIAKGMSWMKTNMTLTFNETDTSIADIMTDGCNMGMKSLRRYLNQYSTASDDAKNVTKKLIEQEQQLVNDLSIYL